jgi:outer membrane protein OmpA-like peptidoglycan-associated protein
MLVGSTESDDGDALGNHGRVDILLLKIGLDGSLLWRKVMGGSLNDEGYGISRTHDGFFYVTGTTFSTDGDVSFNHGLGDVWLVKLNEKGDIVWEKTFGGSRSEGANAVITTFEGDALVVGTVSSSNQDVQLTYGKFDGWILKVDPRGNLIWERACGGSEKDEFFAVAEAPSGDYITVGYSNSDDYDLVSLQKNTGTDIYVASLTNPDDDRRATSLTPTVLMGYVRDALTGKFIKAEVALLDDNNLRTLYTGYTDTTYGIYQVLAPDTLRMSVGVFADGYMFTSRDVFITPNEKYGEVRLDFELKPFNKDSSFVLRNIEFDTGTQVLRDVSKIELNRLAAFLEKNPRMKIRIIGHTDSTGGNPEGKLILSKRRAISVKGYLVSIGIDKDRIETDGFGMSKPLVKEVTEEDRQLNRRVEIKLLVW